MTQFRNIHRLLALLCAASLAACSSMAPTSGTTVGSTISERVKLLTRGTQWRQVAANPIAFDTQHPQGMVKIGNDFYVTSVEIKKATTRYAQVTDGYDRDPGEGAGHLFKFDATGKLLADLPLGEGPVYHPGGIDYDGRYIWVPVSEYRPNSHAIIYRVDPTTMQGTEVFRYADHVGGIVHNTDDNTLHGVTWGSRRFYRFTLDTQGKVTNANVPPEQLRKPNRAGYIDYQDCKYLGRREMLCSGLNSYQMKKDGPRFMLGGFEIVDLRTDQAVSQMPIELWTESGLPMTYNPFWVETTPTGLRAYFMPEDNKSTLYVYEADVK